MPGIIALVFLALVGAIFNFVLLTNRSPSSLAGRNVETLVAQGLQAQQHTGQPSQVHCPTTEPIRAGLRFTCTVSEAGWQRRVAITEIDGRGTFRWAVEDGAG